MSHKAHHHIEHAEHNTHHAEDPFDRRVALSIAIVAAVLATVTLLSHRAHNETLQLQIQANDLKTEMSDQWAFYQAKNIRTHEYNAFAELLEVSAKAAGKESEAEALRAKWKSQAKKYEEEDLPKIKGKAEGLAKDAEKRTEASHVVHATALRYDLGHLGLELAVVICSVSLLTKKRSFWYGGMICAAAGALVAASVLYYPPGHADHPPAGKTEATKPAAH